MTTASIVQDVARCVAIVVAGVCLLQLVFLGIIVLKEPLAPLLLIGAAVGATIVLFLLQRPLPALFVALFLLLIPPSELRIDPGYQLAANGTLAAAVCSWLIYVTWRARAIQWNSTSLLIALYVAWGIGTLLWAPDLIEGRRKLIAWGVGFAILFLMSNQVRSLSAVDALMRTLRILGWLLVAASLYTILTDYAPGTRLKVFGINENTLGLMLIAMLPGVLWPVLRSAGVHRTLTMALSMVFILCAVGSVALSGSRAGALSLVVLLVAFLFSKSSRAWGFIGFILVLVTIATAPSVIELLLRRFQEEEGGELGGRVLLWEASLLSIRDHLWAGVGIGNGPIELHRYIASLTSAANRRVDLPSHQPFLEVTIETGLVGFIIYSAIITSALFSFLRFGRAWSASNEAPAGYYAIVLGSSVAYATAWIKSGGVENHPSFFVLLGLLLVPSLVMRESDHNRHNLTLDSRRPFLGAARAPR
jgi:putative inorganic carbon (HCO3(-)) transporter